MAGKKKKKIEFDVPAECASCPLNEALLQHPKMEPTGTDTPLVYIMGEAPGAEEDRDGVQFIGRAGQFLRKFLPVERLDQLRWNNTIRCRPPQNREPDQLETYCCRPLQEADIEATKPKAIFGFGNVPLDWAIGESSITKWRGRRIPLQVGTHTCWFYPMLHPSYMMRLVGGNRDMYKDSVRIFDRDIQRAFWEVDNIPDAVVVDPATYFDNITLLTVESEILECLQSFEHGTYTIDIETTGIHPYAKDAAILTVSITEDGHTWAFPIDHPQCRTSQKVKTALHDFIIANTLVAHNAKFEMVWFAYFLGKDILLADWQDTMGQAYVLDERQGVLSLDSLILINFGFHLKALSTIDVSNLSNTDLREVLLYNALDSKYTHELFKVQKQQLEEEGRQHVYERAIWVLPGLVAAQLAGLTIDWTETYRQLGDLKASLDKYVGYFRGLPTVKAHNEVAEFPLNIDSPVQLKRFFADYLQIFLDSTDAESLEKVKTPESKIIMDYRKVKKLESTYISPIVQRKHVHDDGLLHPGYNPYFTVTGRLSSDNPNVQNFPKRENKEIRNVIIPPPGHKLVSFDYGQIEARIIAIMSNDPYFIHALENGLDIHMEWAEKLAEAYPKLLRKFKDMKGLRTEVKNTWVFPSFYGAVLESVAGYLGVPPYGLEPLYNEFWMRFKGVKKWQHELINSYAENGYVETLTGRRRHGPMKTNELINSPVQGTASDITTWAMGYLARLSVENDIPWLAPIMNIHDDLTFAIPDSKVSDAIPLIAEIMCFPDFDWITVPIVVEAAVGDRWGEMKDVAKFNSQEMR